jgi:hypothetical protein
MTVRPFTTIRVRRNRRRAGDSGRRRIRHRLCRRGRRLLRDLGLGHLGVRDHRRLRRCLHRRCPGPDGFGTGGPFQGLRRCGRARDWDFCEWEARCGLMRRQVEAGRRRELEVSFEIIAHCPVLRRPIFRARCHHHGRETDRQHRGSQDLSHVCLPHPKQSVSPACCGCGCTRGFAHFHRAAAAPAPNHANRALTAENRKSASPHGDTTVP